MVYQKLPSLKWYDNATIIPSQIIPNEDNTRCSFISDLTADERAKYWSSRRNIKEESLSIFEIISRRITYSPYSMDESHQFDLVSLEKDIFWKYIANKPKLIDDCHTTRKIFNFKDQLSKDIPDTLKLNKFLDEIKLVIGIKKLKFQSLSTEGMKNLDFHFHNLDFSRFCNILNALRQSISKLAQSKECLVGTVSDINLNENLAKFLSSIFSPMSPEEAMINIGFTKLSDVQKNILANEIKVENLLSCLEYFLNKFELKSYEYCDLPLSVKAKIKDSLSREIDEFLNKYNEISNVNFRKQLELLLTKIQYCETYIKEFPQASIRDTLTDRGLYEAEDQIMSFFPVKILNAHYVSLVCILKSIISDLKEDHKRSIKRSHEWADLIDGFWSLLPQYSCPKGLSDGSISEAGTKQPNSN